MFYLKSNSFASTVVSEIGRNIDRGDTVLQCECSIYKELAQSYTTIITLV